MVVRRRSGVGMKITSRMLPSELVQAVRDDVEKRVAADRRELNKLDCSDESMSRRLLGAILRYGIEDRELVNRALDNGSLVQSSCYDQCHDCCSMLISYEVETFDILLSYTLNHDRVLSACRAGKLDDVRPWCGLLEDGLCTIHRYKPYSCLLTLPSPKGASRGGCYFRGQPHVQIPVHELTMMVTGRMRTLFREYLPGLPAFAGHTINQAFRWAVGQADAWATRNITVTELLKTRG